MRVLFAGTPEIAVPSLRLVAGRHQVVSVLTGSDKPIGRGRRLEPSAVKRAALDLGIPVIEGDRLDAAVRERVAAVQPEVLVVVAFGRIFRERFLALFPRGGVNLHPSLLPRHRGPAPISAAILAGDSAGCPSRAPRRPRR
jgi:methionyl-tRNA formyltransferase